MFAAKSNVRPVLAGLGVLILASSAAAFDAAKARELLMRTMVRENKQHITAIIAQKMVDEPGRMQQIQVIMSRDGQIRQTVLQPLSLQGMETVDNGKVARTFIPDRKMVIEMPSPRLMECDADFRIKLAEKNYKLKSEDGPQIAGRSSVIVTATPKSRDLSQRRYYIDPNTGYLLKLETVDGSKVSTAFETKFVAFPRELPRDTFVFSQITGNVKVVVRKPEDVKDPKNIAARVDFEPMMPRSLPHGFVVEDVHVVNPDRSTMVGVRITDGLVKGTVYQWVDSERNQMSVDMDSSSMMAAGKLRLMLVADIPEKARKRILQSFAATQPSSNSFAFFMPTPEIGMTWRWIERTMPIGTANLVELPH